MLAHSKSSININVNIVRMVFSLCLASEIQFVYNLLTGSRRLGEKLMGTENCKD